MRCLRWWKNITLLAIYAAVMMAALGLMPPKAAAQQITPEEIQTVRARIKAVDSADPAQLASALGIRSVSKEAPADSSENFLQELDDLKGDGFPEYALKWAGRPVSQPDASAAGDATPSWSLFLLAWDGAQWQVSPLLGGFEPFRLEVLPATQLLERAIAVVVYAGATAVPFPVVFRIQGHAASLVWDGRSDETRYQGYDGGGVEFRTSKGALQMVAAGRADPGLLVFPKTGSRGFEARTVYTWEGGNFVPMATEYAANRDFTLYRFIAALHLHDFRTAYGLIEPAKFLKTDKPSLAAFRKLMEDHFPEFLDEKIFRAEEAGSNDDAFKLELPDRVYIYAPAFSGSSGLLLGGLERREQKREAEPTDSRN